MCDRVPGWLRFQWLCRHPRCAGRDAAQCGRWWNVICDTRDFGIGRRVTAENWKALRAVGESANQRLCDAQAADARPAPVVATAKVTRLFTVDGQHAPVLPFGDPRVMAVLTAIVGLSHLLAGFDNPTLVRPSPPGWAAPSPTGRPPTTCVDSNARGSSSGCQATRYQLTPLGRRFAVLFTKVRACPRTRPGRARPEANEDLAERSELAQAWRQLDRRLKPIHQLKDSPQPERLGLPVNSVPG